MLTILLLALTATALLNLLMFGGNLVFSIILLVIAAGLLVIHFFFEKKIPPVISKIVYPSAIVLFCLLAILSPVGMSEENVSSHASGRAVDEYGSVLHLYGDHGSFGELVNMARVGIKQKDSNQQSSFLVESVLEDYFRGYLGGDIASVKMDAFPPLKSPVFQDGESDQRWKDLAESEIFGKCINNAAVKLSLKGSEKLEKSVNTACVESFEETEQNVSKQLQRDCTRGTRPVKKARIG